MVNSNSESNKSYSTISGMFLHEFGGTIDGFETQGEDQTSTTSIRNSGIHLGHRVSSADIEGEPQTRYAKDWTLGRS